MNSIAFIALVLVAEFWILWLVYQIGFSNGWIDGLDKRENRD